MARPPEDERWSDVLSQVNEALRGLRPSKVGPASSSKNARSSSWLVMTFGSLP